MFNKCRLKIEDSNEKHTKRIKNANAAMLQMMITD